MKSLAHLAQELGYLRRCSKNAVLAGRKKDALLLDLLAPNPG